MIFPIPIPKKIKNKRKEKRDKEYNPPHDFFVVQNKLNNYPLVTSID